MGFLQTTLWNNIFKFAYPLAFVGSISYGLLAILQMDLAQAIGNPKMAIAFNILFGLCGILALASWAGADVSGVTNVTQYIDLDASKTVSTIQPKNN
jgi:uncharacterized membrane protein YuzA (DUF378 family)